MHQEDSPGEGNGYPLQYSFLENPMDRESDSSEWLSMQYTCYLQPCAYGRGYSTFLLASLVQNLWADVEFQLCLPFSLFRIQRKMMSSYRRRPKYQESSKHDLSTNDITCRIFSFLFNADLSLCARKGSISPFMTSVIIFFPPRKRKNSLRSSH